MSGLQLAIGEQTLAGYLLAVARLGGFVLVAPPFNTRAVPGRARAAFALALALPLSVWTIPGAPGLGTGILLGQMLLQVLMGLTFGFIVLVAISTIQVVGDIVDVVGGFSVSVALDPMALVQTTVMSRLHQFTGTVLLFGTGGHLIVLQGLARSVRISPDPVPDWEGVARALTQDVAGMMLAALQVVGPVMAAMLITDIVLGLLTRAAPALNAFSLGFPLKILLSLLLVGLVVAQLPELSRAVVERAAQSMLRMAGGG